VMGELELLGLVSDRLREVGVAFMLTGSFALAYYAIPRMTRNIDLVVALDGIDPVRLARAFERDFYVDADAVRDAIASRRMLNLMHLESGIKVDLIVRRDDAYRRTEFARRQAVRIGGIETYIVSREDLILSKLAWARDSASELQRRDVRDLIDAPVDRDYLRRWAPGLGARAGRRGGPGGSTGMNDTAPEIAARVAARCRDMTPEQRMRAAASLYDTACAIVDASLPQDMAPAARRLARARRMYGDELTAAALQAHADWTMAPH
jgi:predicted nucleotidyltransferase